MSISTSLFGISYHYLSTVFMRIVRLKKQYTSIFVLLLPCGLTWRGIGTFAMQDVICWCSLSRNLTSIAKTTSVCHTKREEEALHIQVKRLSTFWWEKKSPSVPKCYFNFGNLEQLSLLKRKRYECGFCYIYHYHITRCDFFRLIHALPTVTDNREIFSMTFHGGERFTSLISLLCRWILQ